MRLVLIGLVCVLTLQCSDSWAVYEVRISDLGNTPTPPNPIGVCGIITSESPMKLSDGRSEVVVNGLAASVGDFVTVTGDWNGSVLSVTGSAQAYLGPARVPMVYIPAGSFPMGNNGAELYTYDNELPQHSVHLSGYWVGKYEVTRGEYQQFMNAGGYSNPAYWSSAGWSWKGSRTQPDCWAAQQDWGTGPFTQTDSYPVVGVSYYEAEAFCNWAGGGLLTEAQWEKAARWTGSYPDVYPWGNVWDVEKCNNYYHHNAAGGGYGKWQTAPVGSYPSGTSPHGCQDMAGNVYEWCKDWYLSNYYSQTPPGGWVDPQGPPSGAYRVLRGGGWYNADVSFCRCAFRVFDCPRSNYFWYYGYWSYYGFRMAR